MRFSNHLELRWAVANQITLIPFGWWMQQGKALNRAAGLRAEFGFSENTNVSLGAAYRKNDAAILQVGLEHGIHSISLAYDINTSGLHSVTNSKGALELAYVVLFGKKTGKGADQDKDGIPDEEDDCPTVKGAKSNKGCPPTGVLDTDGDGVIDTRDDCPTDPGLVMLGGCNDKDGDGIRDMDDRCPNLPGDKAAQGCPLREMDYDNDGILDMDDKCPYVTGLAALKGCPDTDGDGVSDLLDRCPYLKGDVLYNGCPTGDAPAEVGNTEEHVIVEFETNKWNIAQRFNPLLDKMVAWLYQHPEKKIIITGHTDTEGDATSNYLLGIHRSQEVQNYFIQRRISPDRIKTISYGETIPKSENTSAYGKARNRRVEVLVTE
jgi:hypothetical protein